MPRAAWMVVSALLVWAAAVAPARAFTECPDSDRVYHQGVDDAAIRAGMLCLVNTERRARGLAALTANAALDVAATRHSVDMAARDYVGHVAPAPAPFGVTPHERAALAGYPAGWDVAETVDQTWVENAPEDPAMMSARAAMKRWIASQTHCAAILTAEFRHLGVGMVQAVAGKRVTAFWTLVLGGPGESRTPYAGCPFSTLAPADTPPGGAVVGAGGAPGGTSGGGAPSSGGGECAGGAAGGQAVAVAAGPAGTALGAAAGGNRGASGAAGGDGGAALGGAAGGDGCGAVGGGSVGPAGAAVGATGLWLSTRITLSRGARTAGLVLRCSRAAGPCRGTATLWARGRLLGRGVVTVAGGVTRTVAVHIRVARRRALAKRVTRASLRLDAGGARGTVPVSLRPR